MLIDDDVVRTIHRPENQLLFVLEFHQGIHVIFEVIPMARAFVKIDARELRCVDVLISQAALEIDDITLEN